MLILSVFLAALALAALGIRLLTGGNADFPDQSCSPEENGPSDLCSECAIRSIINCERQEKLQDSHVVNKDNKDGYFIRFVKQNSYLHFQQLLISSHSKVINDQILQNLL